MGTVDGGLLILRPSHVAQTMFRTIDAHGRELCCGSANPADPAATRRGLTIMLASERRSLLFFMLNAFIAFRADSAYMA
jgi:Protein of unknown function (DUF3768)